MHDDSPTPEPHSRARQNATIAVLAFAGMGASFVQTILVPLQGELPRLLGAGPSDTAWVITATLLSAAISTPIAGKLGDMFGKRKMALMLLSFLLVGSIICAIAPGIVTLIVGRALQGAGMGVIPLGISLLRDVVHADRLGTAIALVSATLGVGGAIGLPLSAFVTEHFDWHMVFVPAIFFALAAIVLVILVVPASPLRTGGRVDVVGALGLAVGLTGVLLAVSQGNTWGWASPATLVCLGIGVVVLAVWGWYELRVSNPLVDLRVSVKPAVLWTNLAGIAMGFALFASTIALPQLLSMTKADGGLGLSLLQASLVLMPSGLGMLAMSPVAGRVERAVGPKPLLIAGASIIGVAYALCLFIPLTMWVIGAVNLVIGIGIGLGYAAMPALIIAAVPSDETASANGLNTLMRSFGTTVAAAVVGAILAAGAGAAATDTFPPVFVLGLAAAAACVALACLIPRSKAF